MKAPMFRRRADQSAGRRQLRESGLRRERRGRRESPPRLLDEPPKKAVGRGYPQRRLSPQLADVVDDARGFELFLGFPNRGDLGIGVDHVWNRTVIHMTRLPDQNFRRPRARPTKFATVTATRPKRSSRS